MPLPGEERHIYEKSLEGNSLASSDRAREISDPENDSGARTEGLAVDSMDCNRHCHLSGHFNANCSNDKTTASCSCDRGNNTEEKATFSTNSLQGSAVRLPQSLSGGRAPLVSKSTDAELVFCGYARTPGAEGSYSQTLPPDPELAPTYSIDGDASKLQSEKAQEIERHKSSMLAATIDRSPTEDDNIHEHHQGALLLEDTKFLSDSIDLALSTRSHAPLFSHECTVPCDEDDGNVNFTPKRPPQISQHDSPPIPCTDEFKDPVIEVFPLDATMILKRIATTGVDLPEDQTRVNDLGGQLDLARFEMMRTPTLSHERSTSCIAIDTKSLAKQDLAETFKENTGMSVHHSL